MVARKPFFLDKVVLLLYLYRSMNLAAIIHFHFLMKFKIRLAIPRYSANWIAEKVSGRSPVHPKDSHKTAFSPGPGMGLYEFTRLPFGLTGAPGTFQLLIDHILRGLEYVIVLCR